MPNNYNKIAKHYDLISRLVFGKSIIKAQVSLLQFIPPKGSVLIVGGGTGWILEEISAIFPQGLMITYVEISSQMISLAQKRNCAKNTIDFVNKPVESFIPGNKFDVIITPFLFDNFMEEKIKIVFAELNASLKMQGRWLFADFVNEKNKNILWQKMLLKTMYIFFRITCNIETQKLIDMEVFFKTEFSKINESRFYAGFIKAAVYEKHTA
jgi:ubiquinone/menaquinone biosynthesis C-methylase UbiE